MKYPLAAFARLKVGFKLKSACHQMTLISNIKGPFYGQPIALIPNKLYFACYEECYFPSNDDHCVYIPINDYVHYDAFYDDFGPYNLAVLYRFIKALDGLLKSKEKRTVVCYTSSDERDRVNGAYLMAGFMILIAGYTAEKALSLVIACQPPPFIGFKDASLGPPIYNLHLSDCIKSIEKAIKFKWFDYYKFDPDEYEFYERVENGDFNWIIPGKILSFCGPHNKSYVEDEYPYHSPETYFDYFKKNNITTVIRLNKKLYNSNRFTQAGFEHYDLFFIDGSTPSDEIVNKFIDIVDNAKGGVAIHCKAGLGRTGTLIACWMMKEYRITAQICMAWLRISRPGSVIGPQQIFLIEKQQYCWNLKHKKRSLSPKNKQQITTKSLQTTEKMMKSPTILRRTLRSTPTKSSTTYDETAINEHGQSQGDRLLSQKVKQQHHQQQNNNNAATNTSNVAIPSTSTTTIPPTRTPTRYSSATTPIKQLKLSSKRSSPIIIKSPATRSLMNSSNNTTINSSSNNNSFKKSDSSTKRSTNIPISRVTVSSSIPSQRISNFKTTNPMIKKPSRTQPYPSSSTISNNISKMIINKYELRPRKGLNPPQKYDPGKSLQSPSILARLSVSPKTK